MAQHKAAFDGDAAAKDFDWSEPGSAPHDESAVIGQPDADEVEVFVPEGKVVEVARALNDAAGDDVRLVRFSDGTFTVPKWIADKADLPSDAKAVDVPPADVLAVVTPGRDADGEPFTEPGPLAGESSSTSDGGEHEASTDDGLEKKTVAELRKQADKNKIDLTGAEHKADIIARLRGQ